MNTVIKLVRERTLQIFSILILVYLMLPLAVIILLSFNKPKGRQNTSWNEFSLDAWTNICRDQTICRSFSTSISLFVFLPLATPEVILGASLLALFLNIFIPLGFWTILLAQITFTISFVVVVVNARLAGMDPRLEQAAMDLYATPFQTFRLVTLPIALPGILAAALLSFSLSFDDFIVTSFNSGRIVTFPIYIWGAAQRGIPPQVNVIASLMFLGSLALVLVASLISKSRKVKV